MEVKTLKFSMGTRDIEIIGTSPDEEPLAIELLNSFLSSSLMVLATPLEDIEKVMRGEVPSETIRGGGGFVEMEITPKYCALTLDDNVLLKTYSGKVKTSDLREILLKLIELEDGRQFSQENIS